MTLDKKLSEIGIKRMLVVDDIVDNIEAAREYFQQFSQVHIDYAYSAKDAIAKIQEAYSQKKYDLVLSDMQMEEKTSGQAVIAEASKHQAIGIVVTSRGPGSHGAKTWGEGTKMICPCMEYIVETPKSQSETWEALTVKSIEYMTGEEMGEGKRFVDSMQRFSKYVGKPSDALLEIIKSSYDFKSKEGE